MARRANAIAIYALVANANGKILTESMSPLIQPSAIEAQQDAMKCSQLAERSLAKICEEGELKDHKKTLATKIYAFHYQVEHGYIFMCIAERDFPQSLAFELLSELVDAWNQRFKGQIVDLTGEDIQRVDQEFQPVLKKKLAYYGDESSKLISDVQGKVAGAKGAAHQAMNKVIKRHEDLNLLTAKTHRLDEEGKTFVSIAKDAKSTACWQYYKTQIILISVIVVAILVLFFILGSFLCGGITWPDCGDHGGTKHNEDHHHN